jgi:hypothetical protein
MLQYALNPLPDDRYGIYAGQTLLATIGDYDEARMILHHLAAKQLMNAGTNQVTLTQLPPNHQPTTPLVA